MASTDEPQQGDDGGDGDPGGDQPPGESCLELGEVLLGRHLGQQVISEEIRLSPGMRVR